MAQSALPKLQIEQSPSQTVKRETPFLMSEWVTWLASFSAELIEITGILLITVFALWSLVYAVFLGVRGEELVQVFHVTRQRLGRGILLGLEFLVAADIIYTVAVDLTFTSVGVLAVIVAVRTFLSFTLDVELTGRWPWQDRRDSKPSMIKSPEEKK